MNFHICMFGFIMLREFVLLNTNLWISFMRFYMHVYHWPHQSSVKFSISYWSYARISFMSFYTHTHTHTHIYIWLAFLYQWFPWFSVIFIDLVQWSSLILVIYIAKPLIELTVCFYYFFYLCVHACFELCFIHITCILHHSWFILHMKM